MKQEAGMKRCGKCGEIKPITEFHTDRARVDGLTYRCKECTKQASKKYQEQNPEKGKERARRWREENKEKARESKRRWQEANPEKVREVAARSKRKMLYGLTDDAYLQMLSDQNNRCAICGRVFEDNNKQSRPHVDHDHDTGTVRGLLCNGCNTMLGYALDNPETLAQGIQYLKQHNQ